MPKSSTSPPDAANLPTLLLDWYDRHRRVLPWRAPPGKRADPYHVWLSEIMLQQTTVVTVGPYFRAFLEKWPTVGDLAAAALDDVLTAWAGLGYYARARNLHKCAKVVSEELGGRFPDTEEGLAALPGIGAYTAAAVAAIAFDRPASAMDGNVERVTARLHAVADPLPGSKPILRDLAAAQVPNRRPGDYAQAVMDLGATVCTPRKPKCLTCPWSAPCRARALGIAEDLPAKSPKKAKPTRRGVAFWCLNPSGAVLVRRRPERGLLGGMMEIPSTEWIEGDRPPSRSEITRHLPVSGVWQELDGVVRHTFTHFHLELVVHATKLDRLAAMRADGIWHPLDKLDEIALPTVMAKVVKHALRHA